MPRILPYVMTFLSASLAGCANMGETIERRVAVAEICRQAMEAPLPQGAVPNAYLASVRMGDVGSCQLGDEDGILALCAYDQIWKKHQGSKPALLDTDYDKLPLTVDGQTTRLRRDLNRLKVMLRDLAAGKEELKLLESATPKERVIALQGTLRAENHKIIKIGSQVDRVRGSLAGLRTALEEVKGTLGEQTAVELTAWDHNLRAQLEQLEQVLNGNISLLLSETLKDQVVRHVAKRSLDLVHGALKPAQAVIDKLDSKAYGLVSVGYLAFQSNLQDAVDKTYVNIKAVYDLRLAEVAPAVARKQYVDVFLGEMQRAACENLIEGSKFSMLTELVDTMLINKVQASTPLVSRTRTEKLFADVKDSFSAMYTQTSYAMADDSPMAVEAPAALASTPLSVYVSNEWAARQQLLIQSISAQRKVAGNDGARLFSGIGAVDEAEVRRLADAATARVIDDASRADPALLDSNVSPFALSSAFSSNVQVVTAASAVSQANAVLTANISNSSVNTFTPTNNNAPVFNLPAYPAGAAPEQKPPPSLCSASTFGAAGATCIRQDGDYIIVFDGGVGYANDACQSDVAQDRLARVADTVRDYGQRYAMRFETSVAGYASLKRAALKDCPAARQPREVVCTYRNMAREEIAVAGCANPNGDKNRLLSAARAKYAAATLEQASGGSLLVRRLAARGAQAQDDIYAPYLPAAEQTVVLRFRPAE